MDKISKNQEQTDQDRISPLLAKPLNGVDPDFHREISRFGAQDMEICMQCGNCSASCPLSQGDDTFPRKVYRYIQLGLKDKLLASPVPWLCYYCGECNKDCPRGAEPAETMMAARRWLTSQYDWTGLAKRLYLSEAWEMGALGLLALGIILLFVFFHGPIITDRVAVNTFAPVMWIEIGDLTMAAVLTLFLLSNAFRMYRFIMAGTKIPIHLYFTEAKSFLIHFATQKRWRKCGEDKTRWVKHFILVTGYMTMMTLIIVFIRWFQVDDSSWHFSSLFGYYATGVLLYLTVDMFMSRLKKKEDLHRFSQSTDWLFLVLLFFTTLTGILMHLVRLAGWPMGTYVMYVIHLAIAVPMLVIEVPFGKWSHLFYRPLAIFLTRVREKADRESPVKAETVEKALDQTFMECMQCGTCSGVCPLGRILSFSPRNILRRITRDTATLETVDRPAWQCLTCAACTSACPRGIDIIEVMKTVRQFTLKEKGRPEHAEPVLNSLRRQGNPWNGSSEGRMAWAGDLDIPAFKPGLEYCLFSCCTTAYARGGGPADKTAEAARMLVRLLAGTGISLGTLGADQVCCGDPASALGDESLFSELKKKNSRLFLNNRVEKILTLSPHCFHTLGRFYPQLKGRVAIEHYVELLDRLITAKRILPFRELDRVVTYHDPCYLGRHSGIFEPPRRILKAIPGLTLVEMPGNREKSMCCGGGGGNAFVSCPREESLGIQRVGEALASGADILATACPFCIRMLNDAVQELQAGNLLEVMDVAQLLYKSAGIKPGIKATAETKAVMHQED
ncbi:(Fe-S)-binding protein [Desulfospira joergensenii]|uniref:(Fe-S)-binding protein n=1 Tax=Desulfospira joergensenii TaxID=53329 RepID=UPI0003B4BF08|nr:(Fe-S)-binding protein [Desulfospira joergensenii]